MRSNAAISGSALSAAAETGDEKVLLARGARFGVVESEGAGIPGVSWEGRGAGPDVLRGVEVLDWVFAGGKALMADFKGVLKGERKGLESVWDAESILRRLAAGEDILILC